MCGKFSSQSDHVNGRQWAHLLRQQGVAAEDIDVVVARTKNSTIEQPRAFPSGPELTWPDGVRVTAREDATALMLAVGTTLIRFLLRPEIEAVVWIFLNHGTATGLSFQDVILDPARFTDFCPGSRGPREHQETISGDSGLLPLDSVREESPGHVSSWVTSLVHHFWSWTGLHIGSCSVGRSHTGCQMQNAGR
jgi:hypothetical protein